MWIKKSYDITISFRDLYQFKIKNIIKEDYSPQIAYFKEPISYKKLEYEINTLLNAYTKKVQYKPTIPLYLNNKTISIRTPVKLRLNYIAYALQYIPHAYYELHHKHKSNYYIKPCNFTKSTYIQNIKLSCILILTSCTIYFNNVKYSIVFLIILTILFILWIL
jgi:hypothetical protein